MTAGLVTYDSSGNVLIDTTKNIGVLVQVYSNVSANASYTIPGLTSKGTPFSFILPLATYTASSQFNNLTVTISANTVSWTYETKSGATNLLCNVYVGVR
jgi:hypothetical protein